MTENVLEIKTADPDSHFRLRRCKVCHEQNAAYVRYQAGDSSFWQVKCPVCGHVVDKKTAARHDAQIAWNEDNL